MFAYVSWYVRIIGGYGCSSTSVCRGKVCISRRVDLFFCWHSFDWAPSFVFICWLLMRGPSLRGVCRYRRDKHSSRAIRCAAPKASDVLACSTISRSPHAPFFVLFLHRCYT